MALPQELKDDCLAQMPEEARKAAAPVLELTAGMREKDVEELFITMAKVRTTSISPAPVRANSSLEAACEAFYGRGVFPRSLPACPKGLTRFRSLESGGRATTPTPACSKDLTRFRSQEAFPAKQKPVSAPVAVTMSIDKNFNDVVGQPDKKREFERAFIKDLAKSLNVDPSRIKISSLTKGSVVVKFEISGTGEDGHAGEDQTAADLAQTIQEQVRAT